MQRGEIRSLSMDEWDATMALNLRAPFLLAQQAARRMKNGGLIVNVTDAGDGKAWTGFPAYSVSKAGLEALTHILAKALAPNIRVNAIAPGLVMPSKNVTPAEWQKLVDRLPLKRPVTQDEITSALEYLLKNKSVTGQTVVVDSGYSLI
jgi:pteridine reductase